jgi:hypothetical protein
VIDKVTANVPGLADVPATAFRCWVSYKNVKQRAKEEKVIKPVYWQAHC